MTKWPTCSATSPIGCSDRYSPSSSFSQRSRSRTGTSAVCGQRPLEGDRLVGAHVEQRGLPADPVALRRLAGGHGVVEPEQDLAGWPNALSAPTLASDSSTFRFARRRSIREQKSVSDLNGPPSSRAAMIDSIAPWPDVLDREQPEADRVALDGELEVAGVDVRRPSTSMPSRRHSATAAATFSSFDAERRQDAGHVLDGVVRLQVRRLVGDQPVAGRVGLVEAVPLERLERLEDRVDDARRRRRARRPG